MPRRASLTEKAIAGIAELQKQLKAFDQNDGERQLQERMAQQRQLVLASSARANKAKDDGDAAGAADVATPGPEARRLRHRGRQRWPAQ